MESVIILGRPLIDNYWESGGTQPCVTTPYRLFQICLLNPSIIFKTSRRKQQDRTLIFSLWRENIADKILIPNRPEQVCMFKTQRSEAPSDSI